VERIDKIYSDKDHMCIKQTLTYGKTPILEAGTAVFDYFSTLVLVGSNAFIAYQAATGATIDG
jgi:hypothetical protein